MDLLMRWLVARLRIHLGNERGDVIVILLIVFLVWLLVTGRHVVVQ